MFMKMTRLACGVKCGDLGASGFPSGGVLSAASNSEMIPGNSSDPPTSDCTTERREHKHRSVIMAKLSKGIRESNPKRERG
ncbi:hypothetical protein LBMAG52_41470 [Planctomycetia bacterium]|nr:hypothetical protein LBMAG52_41470 [Planctomycetia bacterium]